MVRAQSSQQAATLVRSCAQRPSQATTPEAVGGVVAAWTNVREMLHRGAADVHNIINERGSFQRLHCLC